MDTDIVANALEAPRLTLDAVGGGVARTHYFTTTGDAPGETVTFCMLVLRNGLIATGKSICLDPANYDGCDERLIARDDASRKIWPLMAYALNELLASWP